MISKNQILKTVSTLIDEQDDPEQDWFGRDEYTFRNYIQTRLSDYCIFHHRESLIIDFCRLKKLCRFYDSRSTTLTIDILAWIFVDGVSSHSVSPARFVVTLYRSASHLRSSIRFYFGDKDELGYLRYPKRDRFYGEYDQFPAKESNWCIVTEQ